MSIKKFNSQDISLDTPLYFYNCGTASALPELKFFFSIDNLFSSDGYIQYPANSYASTTGKAYDCLYINDKEAFRFTTPPCFSAYNTAISILSQYSTGDSVLELRKQMIEEVNHYYVRAWICISIQNLRNAKEYCDGSGKLLEGFSNKLKNDFKQFIHLAPNFYFNSKTGEAMMSIVYNIYNGGQVKVTENCGSMVQSSFLQLEGGNHYNSEGYITYNECGRLTSSIPLTISKFNFQYRYL